MKTTFGALLVACIAAACAQQLRPQAQAGPVPVDKRPQSQEERASAPQPKPREQRATVPRHAVRQDVQRVPPVSTDSPSYGPVLRSPSGPTVRGSVPPSSMPTPAPPGLPPPATINSCVGSTCTDAAGATYNTNGNAGVDSAGRLCTKVGNTMQCF